MRAPIFIIGYMACGKTTFGAALAKATGRTFIDLDFYIEQRFRTTIRKMFETEGEPVFRSREAAMLRETGEFENVVIACGGGTPCQPDNLEYMLQAGTVVFLETSKERITERLLANSSRRPLMSGKTPEDMREAVDRGLEERLPFYLRAHFRFSGENLEDRRQIDSTVKKFLESIDVGQ